MTTFLLVLAALVVGAAIGGWAINELNTRDLEAAQKLAAAAQDDSKRLVKQVLLEVKNNHKLKDEHEVAIGLLHAEIERLKPSHGADGRFVKRAAS